MSSWFSNDFVSQRIIFCDFQSINCFLWQLISWKTSTNVQYFHLMTILSTNFNAFSSIENGSFKGRWSMLSWTTMEMNSHQTDSHLTDLFHSFCNFLLIFNIISKLVRERSWQVIALFLFDSDSPKDFHVWCMLNYFVKLVNCVSCCKWNIVYWGPLEIFLLFDRIWVNQIFWSNPKV